MNFKKTAFILLIGLYCVVVAAGLAEVYIRLTADYWSLKKLRNRSIRYNPALFARHVFPRKTQSVLRKKDLEYFINKKGYRGSSFQEEKPPDQIRIMIYGGSAVFDIYASRKADWPHLVQTKLRQRGFENVRVINAGIPGHSSLDSFGRLWTEGFRFNPDYVLLYHGWNDLKYFRTSTPLLRHFKPLSAQKATRFGDIRLRPVNSLDAFLANHSQLYLRLRLAYLQWHYRTGTEGKTSEGPRSSELSSKAIDQFRLTIENFVDLAENTGATPILMTQARLVVPDNTAEQKKSIRYEFVGLTHDAIVKGYETMDRTLKSIARDNDVPLIEAGNSLNGKGSLFADHVHTVQRGSEKIAELTAVHLEKILNDHGKQTGTD